MDKKHLEEIKMMTDKARKSLEEDLKTIRKEQERLRWHRLLMETVRALLEENAEFKKQFESKWEELSQKEKTAIQDKP